MLLLWQFDDYVECTHTHTRTLTTVRMNCFRSLFSALLMQQCRLKVQTSHRQEQTNWQQFLFNQQTNKKNTATHPTVLEDAEQLTRLRTCAHRCIHGAGSRWEPAAGKEEKRGRSTRINGVFFFFSLFLLLAFFVHRDDRSTLWSSPRFLFVSVVL